MRRHSVTGLLIPTEFQRYRLTPTPFVPSSVGRSGRIGTMYRHFAKLIEARGVFHVGGAPATACLLNLAGTHGVQAPRRILDLCSGVGPSIGALVSSFGSAVVRLDLVIDQLVAGPHTSRVAAEAPWLPFRDGSFDMIWSEDAFSHVSDRQQLLLECRRVLRPNGHLVFCDLIRATLQASDVAAFCDAWSIAPIETLASYRSRLDRAGFRVLASRSVGQQLVSMHIALDRAVGDAPWQEYDRWLRAEESRLVEVWGMSGVQCQRQRLLMYPFLESGGLSYISVVAQR